MHWQLPWVLKGAICRPKIGWLPAVLWLCLAGAGMAAEKKAAGGARPDVAAEAPATPRAARQGQWIRVALPIDNAAVLRVKQAIQRSLGAAQGKRPVFVLEFDVPEAAEAGHGTQFEDAHKLARFLAGEELNAATTVAYVPKAIQGHAVLVALACDQIIMAPKATMGAAGADEKVIDKTMAAAYEEISRTRQQVPVEVALGMLDKSRQVLKVQIEDGSTRFVTPAQLNDLRNEKHVIVSQEQIKPAGEPWQFSGAEGRTWRFVSYLASEPGDVIRALELSSDVLYGDPSGGQAWHAIRLDLKDRVTAEKVGQLERLIDEEQRKGANFLCLWIDSPGGDPLESKRLADFLADLDRSQIRTVAYIPGEALADAAMVAMACDQIVMRPGAKLGGPGFHQMSLDEIGRYRQTIRDSLAPRKLRSWSLWAAMIDPSLEVFRATRLGDVEFFSDEELQSRQPKREQGEKAASWTKGELVTTPGSVLQLSGEKALEYRLANKVVENFARFKQHYGLEHDPTLVEPGWADRLVQFLRSRNMMIFLLVLGGLGLYIELHAPGTGIGGFIATVCFAVFFWSCYLEGTATWLVATLFLTGIVCLLLEFFVVPGLGIFGLGGAALILAAIVLATQTFFIPQNEYQLAQLQHSMLRLAVGAAGLIGAMIIMNRWLPKAPVFRHVFLNPPEGEEAETISRREALVNLDNLLGARGAATTPLTPGGKARFGHHLIDVISSGEFIPRDTPVVVTEVHGNRVVVRAADEG